MVPFLFGGLFAPLYFGGRMPRLVSYLSPPGTTHMTQPRRECSAVGDRARERTLDSGIFGGYSVAYGRDDIFSPLYSTAALALIF